MPDREVQEFAGQSMPCGLALCTEMVEAADPCPSGSLCKVTGSVGGIGQVSRPGGAACLIVDDAESVLRAREPEDGAHEIVPLRTVDPACTQDEVRATLPLDGLLSRQLAATVGIQGRWRVILGQCNSLLPIEHIVRGVMDEWCSQARGFFSQHAGRKRVHLVSESLDLLRAIDRREGRRVEDEPRLQGLQLAPQP